jgi:acetyl-CoA acetyltransferase
MSKPWLSGRAAIVGIGSTAFGKRGEFAERGTFALAVEAIAKACADAGVSPRQVDGWASYSDDAATPAALAPSFGCERVRYAGMAWGGGGAGMGGAFLNASMAVATGQADYVVVHRSICQAGGSRFGQALARSDLSASMPEISFTAPFGQLSAAHMFALSSRRHMHRFGTTEEQFAEVSINARLMAAHNPDARFRDPITVEDHHASRMIADPLRLLDCCMESDVAGAVVITSAERARDCARDPVYIAAAAMGAPYRWGMGMMGGGNMSDDDFASAGQRTVAEDLYRQSGLGPDDVDVAMIYDHFTPMVLMGLEDFGFCGKGESGDFVQDGRIRLDGALPVNTHGGNLAEVYAHGITHVHEAVRQLRGCANNQVADARVSLVVGGSGPTPTSAVMLRSES